VAAGQVTHGEGEHEHRDHRAPDVDAVAEARREHPPAQELDGHDEKAGPAGEREDDHPPGSTQFLSRRFSGSHGDSPRTVAFLRSPRISISIEAPTAECAGCT